MTNEMGEAPRRNLPTGLPEQGVLVLQMYLPLDVRAARGADGTNKVRGEFLENMMYVYGDLGRAWVREDYRDQPGQSLAEDNALMQRIKANAQDRAVYVRFIVQLGPDDIQRRHRDLEEQLVRILTKERIALSLIGVTGPRTAEADFYRPSEDGKPEQHHIDLAPYLEKSGN